MVSTYLLPASAVIERHYHAQPYATLVLSGGYEEAGDAGRHRVCAGDVLIHGAFSAHRDLVTGVAARVLDLPLPMQDHWPAARGTVSDADFIARIAEHDPTAAIDALREALVASSHAEQDLPDKMGAALEQNAEISRWATEHGRARETLSRQFRRLYGIDALTFRMEARARRAWRLIVSTAMPLAEIAVVSGHSDQAHMTRAVRGLTGATPAAWRIKSRQFKTLSA
jgi:AraC-like DNA-binding protein